MAAKYCIMAFLFLLPEQWLNDGKEVFVYAKVFVYCDLCMLRFLCMAAKVLCIVICVWQLGVCQ